MMTMIRTMKMMPMPNLSSCMWAGISKVGLLIVVLPFAALVMVRMVSIVWLFEFSPRGLKTAF